MMRILVWMAGTCGLLLVIYRYGFWHEFAALAVVLAACVWILGGAFVISHGMPRAGVPFGQRPAKNSIFADAIAQAEKARAEREAAK